MLADPCANPGIFARGVQARITENSSDNVVFFPLNFYCLQWLINGLFEKKTIILQGFFFFWGGGGGSPTLSRRAQPFPGWSNFFQGGWGVQMLILETHRTCDFPGSGCEPSIPLPSGSAHVTI